MASTISRDERRELRKLTEETFAYLRQEQAQRESQLRDIIRTRIMAESADELCLVQVAMDNALEIATQNGVSITYNKGYNQPTFGNSDLGFKPVDLEQRVNNELNELRAECEKGNISLKQEEIRIKREITLSALTSADARAMLELIPSIDQMLPSPETVAA